MNGYQKISQAVRISRPEGCPVAISDCGILRDLSTGRRYLQIELSSESRRTIAAVAVRVTCYGEDGNSLGSQDHVYRFYRLPRGGYTMDRASSGGIVLPEGPIGRLSVALRQVLAYRAGDRGETIDITRSD